MVDVDPVSQELSGSGGIENLPFGGKGALGNKFGLGSGRFGGKRFDWPDEKK